MEAVGTAKVEEVKEMKSMGMHVFGMKSMSMKAMKGKKGMKSMDKFVDYWRPTICPRCGCLHEVYWS